MMDENGTPQDPDQVPQPPAMPDEPAATPPPPPPPLATPQPSAAQPGTQPVQYQPPAAPVGQSPPKKKPTAIILIIVAIVLLLCAMTACGIGAFLMYASSGPDFQETVEETDIHYEAALALVEKIDEYYWDFGDVYDDESGDDKTALYAEVTDAANADIAEARNELIEAQLLVESLDDSGFTVEYFEAIALLNQSIDTFEMLYDGIPVLSADIEAMDAVMADLRTADDELEESVSLINRGRFSEAKSTAESALASYQGGQAFFEELAATYPGYDFDVQAAVDALYADAAEAAAKAAEAGLADDNTVYKKHVADYKAADEAIANAAEPYWLDDWDLLFEDADLVYEEAWSYYEESFEAWNRAWEAIDDEGLN